MTEKNLNKLALMARGHEIWLELVKVQEREIEIALTYGDAMKADGHLDPGTISAVIIDPDGNTIIPGLRTKDEQHLMTLRADKPGYYISAVDLHPVTISISISEGCKLGPRKMYRDTIYAGTYHQMAKIIVPVGDAGQYSARHVHGIFDILPDAASLVMGKDIALTLLYEGIPVSGVGVCAISRKGGRCMASGNTDEKGIVRLPVPGAGTWMFLARYRDRSKSIEGEYDETVFVTTLVMGTVLS